MQERVSGSITLNGKELLGLNARQILDEGVGYVPEDRTLDGLVGGFSIAENLMLDRSDEAPFVKYGTLQTEALNEFAAEKLESYDIRAQSIQESVSQLSGGNQQKVVLARELSRELSLLVVSQPTRGLDVGSIEFVHEQIVGVRDRGLPVIVVSTELDEVVSLADRIAVMYKGEIIGIVPADTPREQIGLMMAGERITEEAA
jgi:simple sugar transport system ATP-binding protein